MASGDCVLSSDLCSAEGTSTQLMSESLSLSHMSTSESEVTFAGWVVRSAGGVGTEGLADSASIVERGGTSIGSIIGPSLGFKLARLHPKFELWAPYHFRVVAGKVIVWG